MARIFQSILREDNDYNQRFHKKCFILVNDRCLCFLQEYYLIFQLIFSLLAVTLITNNWKQHFSNQFVDFSMLFLNLILN